jgi:hypothetical protein
MIYDGSGHPGVRRLVRRLLPSHPLVTQSWVSRLIGPLLPSRAVNQPNRRQPVVVLLGPVGSGKTSALRSVAERCGTGVVHAYYDFDGTAPVSTVGVLAELAFDLSQSWTARRQVRFIRFTLGLIAAKAPLSGTDREADREELARLIDGLARNRRAEHVADAVEQLVEATLDMQPAVDMPPWYRDLLKRVMPRLVATVTRRPLRKAKRWHVDFPAANAANPLDALLRLNRIARQRPEEVTQWLVEAFLADVREGHRRLSSPDPYSPCDCLGTGRLRHRHSWVLLLDNIDRPAGATFVRDLLDARGRHLKADPDEHDPLLVLASSGRWDPTWESRWLAPWKSPAGAERVRTVPPVGHATYAHWANSDTQRASWYFPVLLEPLSEEETAAILGVEADSPVCRFAQRAAGGLPGPTRHLSGYVSHDAAAGARDVLASGTAVTADRWREVLRTLRLTDHLNGIDLEHFISAAPFVTAPWLVPHDTASLISQPEVGGILTELRTAMWINGPRTDGPAADYAHLQSWVGRLLIAALIQRGTDAAVSYPTQFKALLADSRGDATQEAYCRLALGEVDEVVVQFVEDFHRVAHQDWVDMLRFVTSAPDQLPASRTSGDLYHDVVTHLDSLQLPDPLAHTVTRLTVASWLAANPFAIPDPALWRIIENSYRDLAPMSRRSDVSALHLAAEEAADYIR